MNRLLTLCLTAIIVLSFSIDAAAQEEIRLQRDGYQDRRSGKSVTIKAKDGAEVTVVMDDAGMLSRVKKDEKAEATYRVKNGVNAGIQASQTRGLQLDRHKFHRCSASPWGISKQTLFTTLDNSPGAAPFPASRNRRR